MARTKRNAMNIEETRQKIQAIQLINRLQNHALKDATMSDSQIKAALGLLKKSVPDLANVEVSGPGGGAIDMRHEVIITGVPRAGRDD